MQNVAILKSWVRNVRYGGTARSIAIGVSLRQSGWSRKVGSWYHGNVASIQRTSDERTAGSRLAMTDHCLISVIPIGDPHTAKETLNLERLSRVIETSFRQTLGIHRCVGRPCSKCFQSLLLNIHSAQFDTEFIFTDSSITTRQRSIWHCESSNVGERILLLLLLIRLTEIRFAL